MSESSSQHWPTSKSGSVSEEQPADLTGELELAFEGADDILRAWRRGMAPDPDLTVSEWADQHRWLSSRGAAEPGRYTQRRRGWRSYRSSYMD